MRSSVHAAPQRAQVCALRVLLPPVPTPLPLVWGVPAAQRAVTCCDASSRTSNTGVSSIVDEVVRLDDLARQQPGPVLMQRGEEQAVAQMHEQHAEELLTLLVQQQQQKQQQKQKQRRSASSNRDSTRPDGRSRQLQQQGGKAGPSQPGRRQRSSSCVDDGNDDEQQQQQQQQPPRVLRRPQQTHMQHQETLALLDAARQAQQGAAAAAAAAAADRTESAENGRRTDKTAATLSATALAVLLDCDQERATSLMCRAPGLTDAAPAALHEALATMCRELGVPLARAAAAARRQPRLLLIEPESLAGRLDSVAAALEVPRQQAAQFAVAQPGVLLLQGGELDGRLSALASALGMMRPEATQLVLRRPQLLGCAPDSVSAKLAALSTDLHLGRSQALRVVRAAPAVLECSAPALAARITGLRRLFGGGGGAAGGSGGSSGGGGSSSTRQDQGCVACTETAPAAAAAAAPLAGDAYLRRAVLEEPRLLTRSPAGLTARLAALAQITGLPRSAAADMVAARPALLTRDSRQLQRSWRALSVWRLQPGYKAALVREHPLLLRLSPAEVHGRCRWLRSLMLRDALFHATFRRLPPTLLGVLLLHLPVAWRRLQYLAEAAREGSVPLMDAVQLREAAFAARCPEYARWAAWQGRQGQPLAAPWRIISSAAAATAPPQGLRRGAVARLKAPRAQASNGAAAGGSASRQSASSQQLRRTALRASTRARDHGSVEEGRAAV